MGGSDSPGMTINPTPSLTKRITDMQTNHILPPNGIANIIDKSLSSRWDGQIMRRYVDMAKIDTKFQAVLLIYLLLERTKGRERSPELSKRFAGLVLDQLSISVGGGM